MISAKKNFVYSTFAQLYVIICLIIDIEYDMDIIIFMKRCKIIIVIISIEMCDWKNGLQT